MQGKHLLILAAIAGFSAVMLGAFGAHSLKGSLNPQQLGWWTTAVQYHLIHAVALLGISAWLQVSPSASCSRWLRRTGVMMVLGLLLFSGSLYSMAITEMRVLGMITPFGGLSWLMGWFGLILAASTLKPSEQDSL